MNRIKKGSGATVENILPNFLDTYNPDHYKTPVRRALTGTRKHIVKSLKSGKNALGVPFKPNTRSTLMRKMQQSGVLSSTSPGIWTGTMLKSLRSPATVKLKSHKLNIARLGTSVNIQSKIITGTYGPISKRNPKTGEDVLDYVDDFNEEQAHGGLFHVPNKIIDKLELKIERKIMRLWGFRA